MIDQSPASLWWSFVYGPSHMVQQITERVKNRESIIIDSSSSIPFRDEFVFMLKDKMKESNRSVEDINIAQIDPGKFIRKRFLPPGTASTYWDTGRDHTAQFMTEHPSVFDQRVLLVSNNDDTYESWHQFMLEYQREVDYAEKTECASLVLLTDREVNKGEDIPLFHFADYVNGFDLRSFVSVLCASIDIPVHRKEYLVELSYLLSFNNPEAAYEVIINASSIMEYPDTALDCLGSYMDDSLSFSQKQELINHNIWAAQIKSIYPKIEAFRLKMVHAYSHEILNILEKYGWDYSEYIISTDVEIGSLNHMITHDRLRVTREEEYLMNLYTSARNRLSHLVPLELDEIDKIISLNLNK